MEHYVLSNHNLTWVKFILKKIYIINNLKPWNNKYEDFNFYIIFNVKLQKKN